MPKDLTDHIRVVYLALLLVSLVLFSLSSLPNISDRALALREVTAIAANLADTQQLELKITNEANWLAGHISADPPVSPGRYRILTKEVQAAFEVKSPWLIVQRSPSQVSGEYRIAPAKNLRGFADIWNDGAPFIKIPKFPTDFNGTYEAMFVGIHTIKGTIEAAAAGPSAAKCQFSIDEPERVHARLPNGGATQSLLGADNTLDAIRGTLLFDCDQKGDSIGYVIRMKPPITGLVLPVNVRSFLLRPQEGGFLDQAVHINGADVSRVTLDFDQAFPELVPYLRHDPLLSFQELIGELQKEVSEKSAEEIDFGALKLPEESVPNAGTILCIAIQLYLLANLTELRYLLRSTESVDWPTGFIGLYGSLFTRIAVGITISVLPTLALATFLYPRWFYFHPWLYSCSFLISLLVGLTSSAILWRIVNRRLALPDSVGNEPSQGTVKQP